MILFIVFYYLFLIALFFGVYFLLRTKRQWPFYVNNIALPILAISLILMLIRIFVISKDGVLFPRILNYLPFILFPILLISILAFGKSHLKKPLHGILRIGLLVPLAELAILLIPFLNIMVIGYLFPSSPDYVDSRIVIQNRPKGIMARWEPPTIYQCKNYFILEPLENPQCSPAFDTVINYGIGSNYELHFKGAELYDEEGDSIGPCIIRFNLDTIN